MFKIGLLAGNGKLPIEFAKIAKGYGFQVLAIGLVDDVDAELPNYVADYHRMNVGQLDAVIKLLLQEGVFAVTMIGKVTKERLFNGQVQFDARAMKLMASLPDQHDDTIMLAIVNEFVKEGIKVMDQSNLLAGLLPKAGVLSKRQPTETELVDIDYGYEMALRLGQLDIGQTVVVKNKAIMAVEAIEGTDECILRGGKLGRGDVVVAKTAKPAQDNRFDLPTVGVKTIESMIAGGASVIVMQAERTLLIEREAVIALADANDICIVVK